MQTSSIIMMLLGIGITWGGATFCLAIAMSSDNKNAAGDKR